jgi:predicted MarR family transcription regulator
MTYDLRRLRLHRLIERVPRSHRYRVTTTGAQVAMFYARLYTRTLRPACSLTPQGRPERTARSSVLMPRSPTSSRR